jgi:excisionase family DNA binding protein
MMPTGMPRSVLLEQAAELLGVSRRTVYYRIRDGRLRTVRTINGSQRVLLESIAQLLREEMRDNVVADDAGGAGLRDRSGGRLISQDADV